MFILVDIWLDDGRNDDEEEGDGFVFGIGERIYIGSIGMERDGGFDYDVYKLFSVLFRFVNGN